MTMLRYIHITYDAVMAFASGRTFQSAEFEEGAKIAQLFKHKVCGGWNNAQIMLHEAKNGIFFFTSSIKKNQGVCFDMQSFDISELSEDKIISIFQKVMKYCIRYFNQLPLTNYEKHIPNTKVALIYPFPFLAAKDVEKIQIDRNSSKKNRKGLDFLCVYYFGREEKTVNFSSLNKASDELKDISTVSVQSQNANVKVELSVASLETPDLSIDSRIGFAQWMNYLTETQKSFIEKGVTGPERLEGAAGTGKTLSMVLRCIYVLRSKIQSTEEYHIIFITHSLATKERIEDIFISNWPDFDNYKENPESQKKQSILITTLQEWSVAHLGINSIHEDEYIDKDAASSKEWQIMYIEQAYEKERKDEREWRSYEPILSDSFKNFLSSTPHNNLLEMLQMEVAVMIKGRAHQNYEVYCKMTRPKYSMPLENEGDFNFMFRVYNNYQAILMRMNQYDSDDIILSAYGQISTPIWARRRISEGYDVTFIDETHLFNLNELTLFHYINKPETQNNIIFAIDRSQAVGEWTIENDEIHKSLPIVAKESERSFSTVFRSSPDITSLAFNILSSGATLFTNFENPLEYASFNFTCEEEEKAIVPTYKMYSDDAQMIESAYSWIDAYVKSKKTSSRANVIMLFSDHDLLLQATNYAKSKHKPFEILQSRSDAQAIKKAHEGSKYLLGGVDFAGGLEFDAVIILGVDGQRVPPATNEREISYQFASYAWHNRMYVAVTRAKYAVVIMGVKSYGVSPILSNAIKRECLKFEEV